MAYINYYSTSHTNIHVCIYEGEKKYGKQAKLQQQQFKRVFDM